MAKRRSKKSKKRWIQGAIKRPGAFSSWAKRQGYSGATPAAKLTGTACWWRVYLWGHSAMVPSATVQGRGPIASVCASWKRKGDTGRVAVIAAGALCSHQTIRPL